jgi:transcriptional regulator with XRE-family HTH domain
MLLAGQNIKTIRELKNFTQDYVASQLNMSTPNYSNIENGKTDVTLTRLLQIAKVLEIDYRQILFLDKSTLFNEAAHYFNQGNNALVVYRDELIKQLQIKDEQINKLLAIVEKRNV